MQPETKEDRTRLLWSLAVLGLHRGIPGQATRLETGISCLTHAHPPEVLPLLTFSPS